MPKHEDTRMISCLFCGKNQNEVQRLIAGQGVYICNEWWSFANPYLKMAGC